MKSHSMQKKLCAVEFKLGWWMVSENLAKIKFSHRVSKRQRQRKLFAAAETYFRKLFTLNEIIIKHGHERVITCSVYTRSHSPIFCNKKTGGRSGGGVGGVERTLLSNVESLSN